MVAQAVVVVAVAVAVAVVVVVVGVVPVADGHCCEIEELSRQCMHKCI